MTTYPATQPVSRGAVALEPRYVRFTYDPTTGGRHITHLTAAGVGPLDPNISFREYCKRSCVKSAAGCLRITVGIAVILALVFAWTVAQILWHGLSAPGRRH